MRNTVNAQVHAPAARLSGAKRPTDAVEYFFDHPKIMRWATNRTSSDRTPVLATFDADNAVIWANRSLLEIARSYKRSRHKLSDEDVATLAHEFARVLEYRDIFQDHFLHAERVAALRRRRSLLVQRSTMESYANRVFLQERKAEEIVQRVKMEILSSFDRSQHGVGLSRDAINDKAEEHASALVSNLRHEFLSSAKKEFSRLHDASGNMAKTAQVSFSTNDDYARATLLVRDIRWLFPTGQSVTLADLVDEMISFRMCLVVPLDPNGQVPASVDG